MTIEEKIRAKKEEIKRANRELSKLQDELKKKNAPQFYLVTDIGGERTNLYGDNYILTIHVTSNNIPVLGKIKSAIESLSEKNDKPKSHIDWSNPEYAGYNWAAIDKDGRMGLYRNKPELHVDTWSDGYGWNRIIVKPWASWDKSLIHRPGIKE